MVALKTISITDDNVKDCIELEVSPEQESFVAHNAISLAHAYIATKRDRVVCPYAIYASGTMVGFIMYQYMPAVADDYSCYFLWRFMIDKNHQGKGYGRQALAQVLDIIRQKPHGSADFCATTYNMENSVARELYKSFGFIETDQVEGDEVSARLPI